MDKLRPKEVLDKGEYGTYRSVRAVAILYLLFSVLFFAVGLGLLASAIGLVSGGEAGMIELSIFSVFTLVGFIGLVGSIAVLRRQRRNTWPVIVMAIIFLPHFPIGTILSIYMLLKYGEYRRIVAKLTQPDPAMEPVEQVA